jgi:hypothetical protein
MKHQPEVAIDSDCDTLADAAQFSHHVTFYAGDRGTRRSQQKRARHPHMLEWLADNAWFEGADIRGDIR